MADARTKLDILYQDVLGEIHDVITRVEQLKETLPVISEQITSEFSAVVKSERETIDQMNQRLLTAYQKMVNTAQHSLANELENMKPQFLEIVQESMRKIREETNFKTSFHWKAKIVMATMLILSGGLGLMVGIHWFSHDLTSEEVRQLNAGKNFLMILPQLDPKTVEKIKTALHQSQSSQP